MSTVPQVILPADTHANRPAANATPVGALFPCTTHGKVYQSDGVSNWTDWHSSSSGAPAAHAASHQNGGADELSVAGLSGELADAQPTTLAKISDATAAGRALMDDADAAAQRTTLGLGTVATLASDTDATLAANSNTNVPTQAAVKSYVDAKVAGLSWKQAVRVATTAAGTLASSFENGDTIDGVVLATGDRILIKNQTAGEENGIYTVNASGAPTRATDADSAADILQASVYVSEGTTNADTQWTLSTNAPITLGTTALTFSQLSSGGIADGDKGDITVSGAGSVFTIDPRTVTIAKIQAIATARLLGRSTAGSGDIEELTVGAGLSLSGGALSATGGGSSGVLSAGADNSTDPTPGASVGACWAVGAQRFAIPISVAGRALILEPGLQLVQTRLVLNAGTESNNHIGYAHGSSPKRIFCPNYGNGAGSTCIVFDVNTWKRSVVNTGTGPYGAVYCPTNNCVYIVNVVGNSVTVINATTLAAVTTITVGTLPVGLCYCPSNDRIYVANRTSNSLSVINPSTNTVVTTISSLGAVDFPFYVASIDRVIVSNTTAASELKVIDPDTDTVDTTISGLAGTAFGAVDVPSESEYWVAIPSSNLIDVRDYSHAQVTTISGLTGIRSLAYSPKGWVLGRTDEDVRVFLVNTSTRDVSWIAGT